MRITLLPWHDTKLALHQKELKWLSYNKKKKEMGESTPKKIGVAELRRKRKKKKGMGGKLPRERNEKGGGVGMQKQKTKKKRKRKKSNGWESTEFFFFFKKKEQKKRREKLRNGREFSEREVKELSWEG